MRSSFASKTGITVADILAAAYVAPREAELVALRRAVQGEDAQPEQWERASVLLAELAYDRAARMFRQVADNMRNEGKRYTLTYPNGEEHIVEVA